MYPFEKENSKHNNNNIKKNKVRKWNNYSVVLKIKSHSNHSKKEYFSQPICS